MHRFALCLAICLAGCSSSDEPSQGEASAGRMEGARTRDAAKAERDAQTDQEDASVPMKPLRVLVFSRTAAYRHEAIEPGEQALRGITAKHSGTIDITEDPVRLAAALPSHDVLVFMMTTGDVLGPEQQTQVEQFVRRGGGYLGIHAAADTEYDWPFFQQLNGAWFSDHPAIQPARVKRESAQHAAVSFLPDTWERTDEWYNFRTNPRPNVQVLLTLDESSYQGGTMGGDHPIAWCHRVDDGRAFYTGLGHTLESWQEPLFLQHIEAALLWAAGR
jgi:type 1 glutamine amidotransferase